MSVQLLHLLIGWKEKEKENRFILMVCLADRSFDSGRSRVSSRAKEEDDDVPDFGVGSKSADEDLFSLGRCIFRPIRQCSLFLGFGDSGGAKKKGRGGGGMFGGASSCIHYAYGKIFRRHTCQLLESIILYLSFYSLS